MSDALNRLNKLSRYVCIGVMLLVIFFIIAAVASAICLVAIAVNPDFAADILPNLTTDQAMSMFATLIVALAIEVVTFYVVYRLFANIHKSHTPFLEENANYLRSIAILILVGAIVTPLVGIALNEMTNSSDPIFEFNIGLVFVAFLVYLVSLVFRYGIALQKESDETL